MNIDDYERLAEKHGRSISYVIGLNDGSKAVRRGEYETAVLRTVRDFLGSEYEAGFFSGAHIAMNL